MEKTTETNHSGSGTGCISFEKIFPISTLNGFCLLGAGALAVAYFAKKINRKVALLGGSACALTALAHTIIFSKTTFTSKEEVLDWLKNHKEAKTLDLSSLPESTNKLELLVAIIDQLPSDSPLESINWEGGFPEPFFDGYDKKTQLGLIKFLPYWCDLTVNNSERLDREVFSLLLSGNLNKAVNLSLLVVKNPNKDKLCFLLRNDIRVKTLFLDGCADQFDQEALDLIASSLEPNFVVFDFDMSFEQAQQKMNPLNWKSFINKGYSIKHTLSLEEGNQHKVDWDLINRVSWENINKAAFYLNLNCTFNTASFHFYLVR